MSMPPSLPAIPQRVSLVTQTVESLCEGILAGHWQAHLPGERELCENLQVSRRTLRAALGELERLGWVEADGRQRRRILQSRRNAPQATGPKTVSILMPSSFLSLPSRITFVMDTLRSRLTAAGYAVQFHIQPACYVASPAKPLGKLISTHPSAAWLVLSPLEAMQRWLSQQPVTCLILGSCAPGICLPSADVDFKALCRHAGHLLWRKGHRHIGLILFKGVYGGDIASEEGLREALEGKPGAKIEVLRHDHETAELCGLLDKTLNSTRSPTAYLVGGATHVLTTMMHLMRRGIRIPQDVSVISRDNDPILDAASPGIARYAIEPSQLAVRIVQTVRQLAETGSTTQDTIRLVPTFVPGESL